MKGAGTPVWDGFLTADDRRVLDPGPHRAAGTADVLVVGGGVIGLAIAAACTKRGLDTVLVERDRLAGQASGRAAGGLSPDVHPELGPRWHALAKRSLALHHEMNVELDYGLRTIDLKVLPDAIVPAQAHCDPLRFCVALARQTTRIATRVTEHEVDARTVVYATGHAPDVADQSYVRGHLIATKPTTKLLDTMVFSFDDDVLVLQLPTGEIVAGGTKEPGQDAADVESEICEVIAEAATRLCDADLDVTHRWTCFRPNIAGDLPIVRRVAERTHVAAGFYSTGILMAPVVGEIVADAIANDTDPVFSV